MKDRWQMIRSIENPSKEQNPTIKIQEHALHIDWFVRAAKVPDRPFKEEIQKPIHHPHPARRRIRLDAGSNLCRPRRIRGKACSKKKYIRIIRFRDKKRALHQKTNDTIALECFRVVNDFVSLLIIQLAEVFFITL